MSTQREPKAQSSTQARPWQNYAIPILIIIATVLAIVLIWVLQSSPTSKAQPEEAIVEEGVVEEEVVEVPEEDSSEVVVEDETPEDQDFTLLETRDPDDPMAVGPVDAPVVMVVFTDYQCMYCAKWNYDTLPTMLEFVEAGDLRIEWRDTNFFGPASEEASRAAYAAALQGMFLEYNDALFADGKHPSESQLTPEALIALAGEVGLDVELFEADMTSIETEEAVVKNWAMAYEAGVPSTPTFVLGGMPIVGAQPTDVFVETFETALAQG